VSVSEIIALYSQNYEKSVKKLLKILSYLISKQVLHTIITVL